MTAPKNSYGDGAWQIRQSWPLWPIDRGRGDTFPKTMMLFSRLKAAALLAACVSMLLGAGARAEPLDPEACKTLKSERQSLLTGEVKAALARGPDWVKDHLHSADQIEQVRQYLQVEAKVAFRCRTDGVVMPKPRAMELPDRKPPVPEVQVAESTPSQVLAGVAADSILPLRKPSLSTDAADSGEDLSDEDTDQDTNQDAANAEAGQEAGDADPDEESVEDLAEGAAEPDPSPEGKEITTSLEPDPGPSQTVADSDKTAPPKTKATQ
jgi:hypothetical protein